MSERFTNLLKEQRIIPLEARLDALSNKFEKVVSIALRVPDDLNRRFEEIREQLRVLENHLVIMDNDIIEIRNSNRNDESLENPASPSPLRQEIMEELRSFFNRRNHSSVDKDYRERVCFQCKATLSFDHYCSRNKSENEEWLVKIWNHPYVEILCCSCHDKYKLIEQKENRAEEAQNMIKDLVKEEREAIEFIQERLNINLLYLEELGYSNMFSHYPIFPHEFSIKDGHVSALKLSNCGLKSVPPEIQVFSHIQVLDLNNNSLRSIPEWVSSLHSLEVLDMDGNQIVEFPKSLSKNEDIRIFPRFYRYAGYVKDVVKKLDEKLGH
jgi:Leucine-rich repeat (LRR) protein